MSAEGPLFCLSCGLNHKPLGDVHRGNWTLRANEVLRFGERIEGITKCEAGILYSLAAAGGQSVSAAVLQDRVSGINASANTVPVFVCRLRKRLGPLCPIETVPGGFGYRWSDKPDAGHQLARPDRRAAEDAKRVERWRLVTNAARRGISDADMIAIFDLSKTDLARVKSQVPQ